MCLYPVYGINKKYKPNKKNGGNPPVCNDKRLLIVPYKCGKCIECRKQKQREWMVRLSEELKKNKGYFVTLTFNQESLKELKNKTGLWWENNPNEIATKAIRLCLERIRKKTKKSIKHWFVTELGENKDRLHLHGIVFGLEDLKNLVEKWNYGIVDVGKWCNEQTVNYIVKYMLKIDEKHPTYTPIVLCSKGIGSEYIKNQENSWQKTNYKDITVPSYTFRNGSKVAMPKYYKDKIFTDKERETMWINNLERGVEWVGGEKIKADKLEEIEKLRKWYRKRGIELFKDDPIKWDEQKQRRREEKQRKYIAENRKRINHENAKGVYSGQSKIKKTNNIQ